MRQFHWIKKGKIFDPTGISEYMHSYAQNPNVIELEDRMRIYFTTRPDKDKDGAFVSYISFIDIDKNDFTKILFINRIPVLSLGKTGEFDEFGTMPGSIIYIKERNEFWLYYVGWTRMKSVPYNWSIGLAISTDGGYTFKKVGSGPILGDTINEPYLHACPRVWRKSEKEWVMWYNGGTKWNDVNGHKESVYVTMYATSLNGLDWNRDGKQVITSLVNEECQTSPSVIEIKGTFHMLFSYRHGINFRNRDNGYRIGHAFSKDSVTWIREDNTAGIELSNSGWDSEMICYPHLISLRNKIYLFYCGNYFGKEGFGYAELVN